MPKTKTATTKIPPSITEIERIDNPSFEQFQQEYVQLRKPVIITGVANQWRAFTEWSADYFKSVAGHMEVASHYREDANFHKWYTDTSAREDKIMTFGELLDVMQGPAKEAHKYYMTEHALGLISPKLLEDLSVGSLIDERPLPGSCTGPTLFIGQDTCMPPHIHGTTEAFMCQLQGTKEVILHGPEQTAKLYALPWYSETIYFQQGRLVPRSRLEERRP